MCITDLKSQIDIGKHSVSQQALALVEKERESVKRVQAAREEEWHKLHAIENEKWAIEIIIDIVVTGGHAIYFSRVFYW